MLWLNEHIMANEKSVLCEYSIRLMLEDFILQITFGPNKLKKPKNITII